MFGFSFFFSFSFFCWACWWTLLNPALRRAQQVDLCELSLVCEVRPTLSSKKWRFLHRNTHLCAYRPSSPAVLLWAHCWGLFSEWWKVEPVPVIVRERSLLRSKHLGKLLQHEDVHASPPGPTRGISKSQEAEEGARHADKPMLGITVPGISRGQIWEVKTSPVRN